MNWFTPIDYWNWEMICLWSWKSIKTTPAEPFYELWNLPLVHYCELSCLASYQASIRQNRNVKILNNSHANFHSKSNLHCKVFSILFQYLHEIHIQPIFHKSNNSEAFHYINWNIFKEYFILIINFDSGNIKCCYHYL